MAVTWLLENPVEATITVSAGMLLVLVVLALTYYALKPKSRRVTTVYLSGEGEEVVASITPSPLNLYWSFIKRFARQVYSRLIDTMHTGNWMDWVEYMISWYGVLVLLSLLTVAAYLVIGVGGW